MTVLPTPSAFRPVSSARFQHAALGDAAEALDAYEADEELVRTLHALGYPAREVARATRAFRLRALTHTARDLGIAQVLEIGPGLPPRSTPASHQLVQRHHHRRARTLYIDHDPLAVTHLNTAHEVEGASGMVRAVLSDLHNTQHLLEEAATHLDLDQPVTLVATGVLDQVTDDMQPHAAVRRLLGALAPGSALVLSHLTPEHDPDLIHRATRTFQVAGLPTRPRTFEEIAAFFNGLTAVGPGLLPVSQWQPTHTDNHTPTNDHTYAAIGLLT
ncbi:SAM-dependent methyltransferase [Streptomyces sp. NPDC020875]|uniref:SAM-dependent methyltransferase n=1 Tax=Streptomyces sp. NPDC020875 TaxID=3154898 RepID=UPI0033E359DB